MRIYGVGGALPMAIVTVAWGATGLWTHLPGQLPSHWTGSGVGAFAATSEVIGTWVLFGYASALCCIGVTFAALHELGWTSVGRWGVCIFVGINGAVAFNLLTQVAVANRRTVTEISEIGFAPSLIALILGFVILGSVAYRMLPAPLTTSASGTHE